MYPNNQMQQPQQQQPLQADPTTQTVPVIMVQPGSPPFLPNIQCPGELQNYYSYIVTSLMHELQNKMTLNAARMYAYNFMAANNFATNEFVNLCQVATDYIDAIMRTNPNVSLEQCLNEVIPDFVGKYCLALTAFFPDLYQYLDANTANYVNPAINAMQQIANTIAQVKQQMQMNNRGIQQQFVNGQMTGRMATVGMGQQRAPVHAAAMTGAGSAANRLFENNPAQTPSASVMAPVNDGQVSRYARQARQKAEEQQLARSTYQASYRPTSTAMQTTQGGEKTSGFQPIIRVAKPSTDFAQPQTTVQEQNASQPVQSEIKPIVTKPITIRDETELVWQPSETQPYKPVYDFTKFKSGLVKVGDDVITVLKELTPEEKDNMNIDDHALTRPPLPRYDATATTTEAEPVTNRTIEVPKFDLEFNDSFLLELSTNITSQITGLRYAINKVNNNRSAAKCYPAIMIEAISVEDDETAERHMGIIEQLAACDTFEKAVAILDSIHDSAADRLFFNRINRLLTQELNNVLIMNFGTFWMDDFFTDVMSVLPAITKKRGPAISQTFMAKQRRFFTEFVMDISRETLDEHTVFLNEEYIQNPVMNPSGWKGSFVKLPWETSFTHLNLPSYELNFNLKPGETGVLSEQTTPELWSLADQILKHEQCADGRRHYIVTQDGVQLLLARGYIKSEAYLIRRVREVA